MYRLGPIYYRAGSKESDYPATAFCTEAHMLEAALLITPMVGRGLGVYVGKHILRIEH
jgi:hypothetical protein